MYCKTSLKLNEILFFSAWILFTMTLILSCTVFSVNNNILELVFKLLRYLAYVICCVKIINTRVKKNMIIPLVFIFFAFMLSYIKSKSMVMPLYSLILLASIEIKGIKIIKVTAWLQGVLLVMTVTLSQAGLIQDYVFKFSNRIRHGLGFSWTTTGTILYFYFMFSIIYIKKSKLKIIHSIIFELINLWFYIMTDSKMAFALCSCFILFFTIQNINKRKWNILSKFNFIYIIFPFLMFVFTLIVYKFYDNSSPIWNKLDNILSGRLLLGSNAIKKYGFSLLGNNIEWVGYSILRPTPAKAIGYNYVDSSYLQLALNYGLIFIFTVLAIYSYSIYKAVKLKDYYLVMIYMFVLVFALTEPRLMNFAYNPFPLLAFCNISPEAVLHEKRTVNYNLYKTKYLCLERCN